VGLPSGTNYNSYTNLTNDQLYILLQNGPVLTYFKIENSFNYYSYGTYSCASFTNQFNINHAVQVIGYDINGNYIIKNSWGTTWGQNGFATISNIMDCGIKLFVFQLQSANFDWRMLITIISLILLIF
jgi:cathepsin L